MGTGAEVVGGGERGGYRRIVEKAEDGFCGAICVPRGEE